jgi:hypothetical protein
LRRWDQFFSSANYPFGLHQQHHRGCAAERNPGKCTSSHRGAHRDSNVYYQRAACGGDGQLQGIGIESVRVIDSDCQLFDGARHLYAYDNRRLVGSNRISGVCPGDQRATQTGRRQEQDCRANTRSSFGCCVLLLYQGVTPGLAIFSAEAIAQ